MCVCVYLDVSMCVFVCIAINVAVCVCVSGGGMFVMQELNTAF